MSMDEIVRTYGAAWLEPDATAVGDGVADQANRGHTL